MKRGLVFVLLLALLLTTPVSQVQAQSVQEISAEILDMTEIIPAPILAPWDAVQLMVGI